MNKTRFLILMLLYNSQVSFGQTGEQTLDIGYESKVYRDYSRGNNSIFDELIADTMKNCRIITTSVWYPSLVTESEKRMTFGDFLPTIELNEKKDYNVHDSITEPVDKFADYYNIGKTHLSSLINYTTQSFLNSKHLPGKYPLVIYIPGMNGFSFENHVLCEEIAKQGYIVISFNSKGSGKRWIEPNTIDYENQVRDVQFIIGESNTFPFIDNSKICLIGHSIGGYINILTKIRDNRITSLVSLDGSVIHDLNRCNEFVYKDLSKVNCPLLSVSAQEFEKARIYLDRMGHADRYYYQTSAFRHEEFKSQTYLLATAFDKVKFENYLILNNLIVSFINKVNNNIKQGEFEELSHQLTNNRFVTASYLSSIPDFSDFRQMVYMDNFNDISDIYKYMVSQYPTFVVSEEELYDWGSNLRFIGCFNQAVHVYKLLIDLYPEYIFGYNGLARTLLLQNNNYEAIQVYKHVLKIEPDNESIKRKLNELTTGKSN